MEYTTTNFAGKNYPFLYSLGLSGACKNILEKIYPEIESGKETIVEMKRTDGKDPYVKIGVKYQNDCKNLFVQMQIASANGYWPTYYKATDAGCNLLGGKLSYLYTFQETTSDVTERMLTVTTCIISKEIQAKVKTWMESEQTENAKNNMIDNLQMLQAQVYRVNYVVQCIIQTYSNQEKDLEKLDTEKQNLSDFAYQLADLINLLIPEQEEVPTPLVNENLE